MISKLANWLDTTNQDPNTGKIYTSAGAYTKQGGNQVEISSQLNSRSLTVDSTLTNDPEARNKFFSNTNARGAINSIFPSGTDINKLESYVNSGATSEQIKKYEDIIDKLIKKDSTNKEFYVEFKIPEGLNPGQTAEYMIKSLEELAEKTGSNPSSPYNY